jgi:hypothetical protein
MAGATPWIVSFFALKQRLKGPLRLGPANQRLSDGAETAGRDAVAEPREELPRDRLATDPWMDVAWVCRRHLFQTTFSPALISPWQENGIVSMGLVNNNVRDLIGS